MKKIVCILLLTLGSGRAHESDLLLEIKGAYLLPVSTMFKNTYGNGGAIYGPECTFRLHKGLYGWLSLDFFTRNNRTLRNGSSACLDVAACCDILCNDGYRTRILYIPLAGGFKYLVPFRNGSEWFTGDFYLGLGIEPAYLQIKNKAPFVGLKQSKWAVGGIAKIGSYFNLPHNFFLDLFFDYSFVWVKHKKTRTNLESCIFGVGVGYRFT